LKRELIAYGWYMLKTEDKILKNIAYVFVTKFIVTIGLPDTQKVIQVYVSLLKSQEYMNQHDHEVKYLSRKALDILMPYLPNLKSANINNEKGTMQIESSGEGHLDNSSGIANVSNENDWIRWTTKIFNEESCSIDNNFALGRFWHIFIKNHQIYYKYRENFNTQMINSMQYIFVAGNSNNLYKKIASDLSFLYIEWQYMELREKLEKMTSFEEKMNFLQSLRAKNGQSSEKSSEIFLNFFIKLAMHNCSEKEEKEVIKRSLYLLKKIIIIWPDTRIKFNTLEKQCQNIIKNEQVQHLEKNRFNFTLLTILNILLEFEREENILENIELIHKLLNYPDLNNCFVNENPYLIKLVTQIIKRLIKISNPKA
jgi:hypothetical protein